jgi:1-acyl-sn-glycerol-3-phosphate acyltransferase
VYWVIKAILKPLLKLIYRIRIEGLENLPKKGPAIIAANHLSFLDSFFIPLAVPRRKVTYLAKADYFKSWKTSWFFKMVGQIPTEREGGKKSQQSLDIATEVLEQGDLLGIYPEGTRSPDGYLHRGRTGVARLALKAGAPVIPCGSAQGLRSLREADRSGSLRRARDRPRCPQVAYRRDHVRDHAALGPGLQRRVRVS